jgi:hypothetical protein
MWSVTDRGSAYAFSVRRAASTFVAALVRSTSPSSIHAAVLVGDARPVRADVVDASLGGTHAGTYSSTAAISRGPGLIDSGIHHTDAGRTTTAVSQGPWLVDAGIDHTATRRPHARRHRGSRRCRACNAPCRNTRGRAVDGLGGSRRSGLRHAAYGHPRRGAIRYLGGGRSRCRRTHYTARGDARCSAVNHRGVGGSRRTSCGNGQQQRRCLQHFRTPIKIGNDAGRPAGAVNTGETCPLPLSVGVIRNVRNENTPFGGRSRSSIRNQQSRQRIASSLAVTRSSAGASLR